MLPKTFFAELAEKSPLVIFNNQLYQVGEDTRSGDFIRVRSLRLGLIPGDSLLELENFYRDINRSTLFEFKKKYIETQLDISLKSFDEFKDMISSQNVLRFIIEKVFPYFQESKEGIDALLQGKKQEKERRWFIDDLEKAVKEGLEEISLRLNKKTKAQPVSYEDYKGKKGMKGEEDELDALLLKYYKVEGAERKEKGVLKGSDQRSNLSVVLQDRDILTLYDQVYWLKREQDTNFALIIDNEEYNGIPFANVNEIDIGYRKRLEDQLKREAEQEANYQDNIRKKMQPIVEKIKEFTQRDSYEDGEVGFVKYSSYYWATLKVPPYILRDVKGDNSLYKFDGCRVAVRILSEDNYDPSPRVVEPYKHPFVSDYAHWQSICMGEYGREHLKKLDKAGQIAGLLSDARKVLQNGYTRACKPHHNLYGDYLSGHRIDKSEVKKLGLSITNGE